MRLKNKNITITGGASGTGLATVERCLQDGANIIMSDLPSATAEQRARELDARHSGNFVTGANLLVDGGFTAGKS